MNTRVSDIFDFYDGDPPELAEGSPVEVRNVKKRVGQLLSGVPSAAKMPARRKIIKWAVIAAAVLVMFSIAAFAKQATVIENGEEAIYASNAELASMRKAGILKAGLLLTPEDCTFVHDEKLFQLFRDSSELCWGITYNTGKYSGDLVINTVSGKITLLNITAIPDNGEKPWITKNCPPSGLLSWYDNYGDLFDTTMTVDDFCEKLCAYWGFNGYSIAAGDGAALLANPKGVYNSRTDVNFTGDRAGRTQYIEVNSFCSGAEIMFGFDHGKG